LSNREKGIELVRKEKLVAEYHSYVSVGPTIGTPICYHTLDSNIRLIRTEKAISYFFFLTHNQNSA
jgi:hypothetical protein